MSVLPVGPRESLRRAGLHRLYPRRRLCDPHAGERALLIRAARKPRCGRNRAAALRRPDRLAQLSHGRAGRSARALWLRRRRPHSGPGRDLAGAASVCLHALGRHGVARLRAVARRGVGRRFRRDAAGKTRCRHHLCAGRRARAGSACGGEERRPGGVRRHSHVGHSELSVPAALGRTPTRLGGEFDPPRRLRIPGHSAAGRHQDAGDALSARSGELSARRSARKAASKAPPCLFRKPRQTR